MFCVKRKLLGEYSGMSEETLNKYGFFFPRILANKFHREIAVETVICNGKKKRLKITNLDHINLIKDV